MKRLRTLAKKGSVGSECEEGVGILKLVKTRHMIKMYQESEIGETEYRILTSRN
jgi:hypothetical protein